MGKDRQLFGHMGNKRKEERMTKLLSQDDQEDGDDINQERGETDLETKRRKLWGCGAGRLLGTMSQQC